MSRQQSKKKPELIYRDGELTAVILGIEEYREMLERLEDIEDLKTLEAIRKKPLKFKKLDDYLKENRHRV